MDFVLVFGSALAFYSATLAPTLVWGDSAWFALSVVRGFPIEFGTAGDHPLFLLIGRAFIALPGDPARSLNFEAAVFGALTVTLVYLCARQLGTSRVAAGVGASALCVSHAFWLHAVITEVYTANSCFLVGTLCLLIAWKRHQHRRYLAAAVALFAVGLTNHLVLAALVPAIIVFVALTRHRALLTRGSLAALASVVVIAAAVAIAAPPVVTAAIRKVWIGPPSIWEYFRPNFQIGSMAREASYYALFLAYQFPSISLLLGLAGIRAIWRDNRGVAALFLLAIAVNAGTFIHHTGWDSQASTKFVFYIADYTVFAIFCALGTDEVLRRAGRPPDQPAGRRWGAVLWAMTAILPPVLYAAIPAAANRYGIDLVHAKTVAYRDNETFFLDPNKHGDDGARRFGEEAMRAVKPSAVIFADYTPFAVLRYLQLVEGVRPDVLLQHAPIGARVPVQWVFEAGQRRPTYLATMTPDYYDLTGLTGGYDLVPAGPIIEVRPRDVP